MHNKIILTTYYTGKPNPQKTAKKAIPNDFEMIRGWYESVHERDLHAIVFHDHLTNEFVQKYSDSNVSFVPVPYYTNRSLNDERFFVYRNFLLEHKQEIEYVLFTDLFDVKFNKNPFSFMEDFEEHGDHFIFVGSENPKTANFSVIKNNAVRAYGKPSPWMYRLDKDCINAGIIGGHINMVLRLLDYMIMEFNKIDEKINSNMFVLAKCIFFHNIPHYTGYPLHSEYRKEEQEGLFCIKHK